jgi:HAAS
MDSEAVHDYLTQLEEAAAPLGSERQQELLADVREHIELALAAADQEDDAAVRAVLGRLGPPVEIVAAETTLQDVVQAPVPSMPDDARRRDRPPLSVETRALLLLTLGAVVLPFIGPALGLWIAAGSRRWSLTQKRTAALIFLVLAAMPFIVLPPALIAGELTWIVTSGGFLLPFVPLAGILAATYLVASTSVVVTVSRRM